MSFKTTLIKALNATDILAVAGYEIDDDCVTINHPADAPSYVEIDMGITGNPGDVFFDDQEIEVDDAGWASVTDRDGETVTFDFTVKRALREDDL